MTFQSNGKRILLISVLLILGIYFSISGLVTAKGFLAPLTVAGLMSMILLPLSGKMEQAGVGRGWSSFVSVLLALMFFMGLFYLVVLQGKKVAEDWPQIKERVEPKLEQLQDWIAEETGVQPARQDRILTDFSPGGSASNQGEAEGVDKAGEENSGGFSGSSASLPSSPAKILRRFFGFVGVVLLTCVYMFFMLLYRSKLRKSLMRFFPKEKESKAEDVLRHSISLSQSYLIGRLILIGFLAVLYAIGLSISGVEHAILISILAAFLTFIPYIGNVVGYILAIAMAVFSGGQILMSIIGISITFGAAQFVESYVLEPYVVGHKVQLNPLATIVVVVLGGALWGIIGMIIIIPLFGIIKIVCDHVPSLKPVGYMLGEEDIPQEDSLMNWGKKIRKKLNI